MARKTNGMITHAKGRSVYIGAGLDYLTFKPGETIYVVGSDGVWPDDLNNTMQRREETAYERGVEDGKAIAEGMARNTRPLTPEEFLQNLLPTLRGFHAKDQNQILAVVLDEMNKDRERRLKELQAQLANTQELIGFCEESQRGLQLVRQGGFEQLNFR
jgi:hypothetical protein